MTGTIGLYHRECGGIVRGMGGMGGIGRVMVACRRMSRWGRIGNARHTLLSSVRGGHGAGIVSISRQGLVRLPLGRRGFFR